jgi:hypothetical protein
MTSINIMRQEIAKLYSGPKWKRRVAKMPDDQVTAIYFREQKRKEEAKKQPKEQADDEPDIPF